MFFGFIGLYFIRDAVMTELERGAKSYPAINIRQRYSTKSAPTGNAK